MKINRLFKKRKPNSGIILIIVLWILVILTSIALSLGRGASVELSLVKHSIGKIKSKYFAWAGLIFAIEQIRSDSADEETRAFDTLYHCGLSIESEKTPQELFSRRELGDGTFSIQYMLDENEVYGFQDEERFLNLNGLTRDNVKILVALINLLGFDDTDAKTVAYSVLDWIDENKEVSDDVYGAEDDYYQGLSSAYHIKNLPFDSKEELLLVRGVTSELYQSLKKHITVYPIGKSLLVNYDTADEIVLRAIARAMSGPATNTEISDADSMVEKMISYRSGSDGIVFSEDDMLITMKDIPFSAPERVLFLVMKQYRKPSSDYFRIQIEGQENIRNVKTYIEAVVDRQDLSIIYWNRS